jgi:predicted GNAT family N-acyltransferase
MNLEVLPRATTMTLWGAKTVVVQTEERVALVKGRQGLSQALLLEVRGTLGGTPLRLLCFGRVKTPQKLRGRGYATELLKRVVKETAADSNLDGCVLFCTERLCRFYERRGWGRVSGHVTVRQGTKIVRVPKGINVMLSAGASDKVLDLEVPPRREKSI